MAEQARGKCDRVERLIGLLYDCGIRDPKEVLQVLRKIAEMAPRRAFERERS